MRYNDVRDGTDVIAGVLKKYSAALKEKKMISSDGLYVDWLAIRQDKATPAMNVGFTAWANAFMNTWNSAFVRSGFDKQSTGFITTIDNKVELQHPLVATEFRRLINAEGASQNSPETLQRALDFFKAQPESPFPYKQPTFGYVVEWLSELGKRAELNGLLEYADNYLKPTWENGGLYYPRNDEMTNEDGKWRHMDPFSGNAAIGYARLNIEDGQKKMWDRPWTRDVVARTPWVDGLDYDDGIDCLRGHWDEESKAMIITLRAWSEKPSHVHFYVRNLEVGNWAVYAGNELLLSRVLSEKVEVVEVKKTLSPMEEVDFIIFE